MSRRGSSSSANALASPHKGDHLSTNSETPRHYAGMMQDGCRLLAPSGGGGGVRGVGGAAAPRVGERGVPTPRGHPPGPPDTLRTPTRRLTTAPGVSPQTSGTPHPNTPHSREFIYLFGKFLCLWMFLTSKPYTLIYDCVPCYLFCLWSLCILIHS